MADDTAEKQGSVHSDSYNEKRQRSVFDLEGPGRENVNAVFQNPLADVPDAQLVADVETFCREYDMMEHIDDMKKGALASKYSHSIESAEFLNESEREAIIREKTHKWDHPWTLYWLCGE